MNQWERELMDLPVPFWDKIDFLLVIGDFKGASEFWMKSSNLKRNIINVSDFLEKMGMKFMAKKRKGHCLIFYSKSSEVLKKILNCYRHKDWKLGEKEHRILGKIYGFPIGAVNIFAKTMKSDYLNKDFRQTDDLLTFEETEKKYKNTFWIDYLSYRVRRNHPSDIENAKKWAKYILKKYPDFDRVLKEKMLEDKVV